jgi:hypothetical protein
MGCSPVTWALEPKKPGFKSQLLYSSNENTDDSSAPLNLGLLIYSGDDKTFWVGAEMEAVE